MQPSKNSAQKLLVISHDVVGSKMAGPGIRYYHLANALSQHIPTTFAVPFGSTITNEGVDFSVSLYDHRNLGSLTELLKAHTICFLPSDIADSVTNKGIPVISYDDGGEITQHAEIEINEIIFTKEVTVKLEELFKKYNDSDSQKEKDAIAIECGKFLTEEIIDNTDDKTGLLNEV